MDLSQIIPRESSFKLKSVDREYHLRLINLEDEAWIQDEFGGDFVKVFEDNDKLSRLIYRLIKDRSDFVKQEVTIVDEEGNESVENIGGYKLLKRMVCGIEDKYEMVTAFNTILGISHPAVEESGEEEEEEPEEDKKKV